MRRIVDIGLIVAFGCTLLPVFVLAMLVGRRDEDRWLPVPPCK